MITSEMLVEAKKFVLQHRCSYACEISKTIYVTFGVCGLSVTKIKNGRALVKYVNYWMEKTTEDVNLEIKNQDWRLDD